MAIRDMIVAKCYRDDEPETYVLKDWRPRQGKHVWVQVGRNMTAELKRRFPHLPMLSESLPECDVWHGEAAERIADALRTYCEIRGPAPKAYSVESSSKEDFEAIGQQTADEVKAILDRRTEEEIQDG